jgi:RES domain-containing protein
MHGGRFTPKGAFETIYLAEDPITALAEVALVLLGPRGSLLGGRNPPWVLVSVEGLLLRVLDLTDPATREAIGTNLQELTGAWLPVQAEGNEAPTQVLGRVCHQTGRFDGIPYPSGKNPLLGVCLAVFPDRLREPASLRVYDPYGRLAQKLP